MSALVLQYSTVSLVPTYICLLIKVFQCVAGATSERALVPPLRVTVVLAGLAGEVLPKSVTAALLVQQSAQILDAYPRPASYGPACGVH